MTIDQKLVARELLLSFWKVHMLHHAAEGAVVGQWRLQELRRHGYEVSPGTLYPLLQRMERNGSLRSKVAGKGAGAGATTSSPLRAGRCSTWSAPSLMS
ncbi:MAG: helix-turn-helix transcriptional regulator [Phycisphaeraceae bacterium]